MPTTTRIDFDYPLNTSLQIGDYIYVSDVLSGGITSDPIYVEKVIELGSDYVIVNKDPSVPPVITAGQFILFSKDINVNESSLKGYYADVTLENFSNKKSELFAISSEIAPSSK
tara:strand:- start:363 stop:704 length:342 start_codon:yes stop_codon:yes gene_type:complete